MQLVLWHEVPHLICTASLPQHIIHLYVQLYWSLLSSYSYNAFLSGSLQYFWLRTWPFWFPLYGLMRSRVVIDEQHLTKPLPTVAFQLWHDEMWTFSRESAVVYDERFLSSVTSASVIEIGVKTSVNVEQTRQVAFLLYFECNAKWLCTSRCASVDAGIAGSRRVIKRWLTEGSSLIDRCSRNASEDWTECSDT